MRLRGLKIAITSVALVAIAAHLIWPELKIDALTLGLLVLAALPWLIPMVKSAEFPGGWKIEFQDIRDAVRSANEIRAESSSLEKTPSLSYLEVFDQDPNLAMVALRVEIEKKVRELAKRHSIDTDPPLRRLLSVLLEKRVLEPTTVNGLNDLIDVGNRAAHGVPVDHDVAQWAYQNANTFLYFLDRKIARFGHPA